MARTDADRVRHAQLYSAATGLRDALRLNPDPDLEQRHRAEWPEQWERLDAVVDKTTHAP